MGMDDVEAIFRYHSGDRLGKTINLFFSPRVSWVARSRHGSKQNPVLILQAFRSSGGEHKNGMSGFDQMPGERACHRAAASDGGETNNTDAHVSVKISPLRQNIEGTRKQGDRILHRKGAPRPKCLASLCPDRRSVATTAGNHSG